MAAFATMKANPNGSVTGGMNVISAAFKAATGSGPNMVQRECWWNQTAYNA